jgi:hypothetical protein
MAGIELPPWVQFKTNAVAILQVIAAEEKIVDPERDFIVNKDRYRPWIEAEQTKPLVNVMIQGMIQDSARSSARTCSLDDVVVNFDMYVIGKAGEVLPVDEEAAQRLDLLVAQVREGLTRLDLIDFGFPIGTIDRSQNLTLTYYSQENEQATGQYAPARLSMNVQFPFEPQDKTEYLDLTELNVDVSDDLAELYKLKFNYP